MPSKRRFLWVGEDVPVEEVDDGDGGGDGDGTDGGGGAGGAGGSGGDGGEQTVLDRSFAETEFEAADPIAAAAEDARAAEEGGDRATPVDGATTGATTTATGVPGDSGSDGGSTDAGTDANTTAGVTGPGSAGAAGGGGSGTDDTGATGGPGGTDHGGGATSLADVPDAGPSALAGGVAAAIDDDRDDFHDIRNAITGADDRAGAVAVAREELTEAERAALAAEVARQQRMREAYEPTPRGELVAGQEVLVDTARPKRGWVEDVDPDGTVHLDDAHRDFGGALGPGAEVTIYADPDHDGDPATPFTADRGRFGLASNETVLERAFEVAETDDSARDRGIQGGNSTADDMRLLEMPDGSRVFATPLTAYQRMPTHVVRGPDAARRHNRDAPAIVEAFGGHACRTAVVRHEGTEYIVKEGVPGEHLADARRGVGPAGGLADPIQEAAVDTYAAGFFAGNGDLHGENVKVGEDGRVYIIDHDSQTVRDPAGVDDMNKTGDRAAVKERIRDLTEAYTAGEFDLPQDISAVSRRRVRKNVRRAQRYFAADLFGDHESPPGRDHPDVGGARPGTTVTYLDPDTRQLTAGTVEGRDFDSLEVAGDDGATVTVSPPAVLDIGLDRS